MRAPVAALGVLASLSLISLDAHACGESLFRIGKGVAYRAQTAPLPGNVLVVAPPQESKQLVDQLAAAGHRVHVVDTQEQVAQELATGKYDVVLASYNDRALIATATAAAPKAAAYIPVTTEASQEALASAEYPRHLSRDDNFTQFLRVIHRTIKEQA
jgi:hypothetical protein